MLMRSDPVSKPHYTRHGSLYHVSMGELIAYLRLVSLAGPRPIVPPQVHANKKQ